MPSHDAGPQTIIAVRVYINNAEVDLPTADGRRLSQWLFYSRDASYQNSEFSYWQDGSGNVATDVWNSRNDAEVGACEETYQALLSYAGTVNNQDVQRVDIEFTSRSGTCNPCKERMDYLREKIKAVFPSAQVTRGDRSRVEVRANYSATPRASAMAGRPGTDGIPTTTYGYAPGMADLRESAVALAHRSTGRSALYYQARITDRSGPGVVAPEDLSWIPDHGGPARSDRDSPSGSLRTPSPTSSDPANPWEWNNERNTYVSRDREENWWAVDPAANEVVTLDDFDRRHPGGYQPGPSGQGQGQGAAQGQGAVQGQGSPRR